MNLPAEQKQKRVRMKMPLLLALIVVLLNCGLQSFAQTENVLPPPKPNLVAVHWPDLTKLESEVREQLASLQNSLSATVKNPTTTEATLGEAYGTMGQIYHAY